MPTEISSGCMIRAAISREEDKVGIVQNNSFLGDGRHGNITATKISTEGRRHEN